MSEKTPPKTPQIIDARDLRCPLPVLRLQKALRNSPAGAELVLQATDPMARIDVPHFCTQSGHRLIDTQAQPEHFEFRVQKRP